MQANHIRAAHARAALKEYIKVSKRTPDTMKTDIIDLMTDLLHLANREDIDCANVHYLIEQNFIAETQPLETAARKHS